MDSTWGVEWGLQSAMLWALLKNYRVGKYDLLSLSMHTVFMLAINLEIESEWQI